MITIIGFTITKHNCGDSMEYTHIDNIDECGCNSACGMCEIETKYVHLAASFEIKQSQDINFSSDFSIIPVFNIHNIEIIPLNTTHSIHKNSPSILSVSERLSFLQSFLC